MRNESTVMSAAMISLRDLERQLKEEMPPVAAPRGVDVLLPHQFVSTVRGVTETREMGERHECKIDIQLSGEPGEAAPSAVYGSRGLGWLDTLEVVMLHAGTRSLTWKRKGKEAEVFINGRNVGRIELGWLLQHAHFGTGRVWFDGQLFCEIALPMRGPASPQPRDCSGKFTFASDHKEIKFLINPKDAEIFEGDVKSGATPQTRSKWRSLATIFDPADEISLTNISGDQRLLLLALSLWPWSFYKVPVAK